MSAQLIETYYDDKEGYHPFFITKDWQVAQLNYLLEQGLGAIHKMDMHLETDEVFVLTKGTAVLISGVDTENGFQFQLIKMQQGVTYNVPVKVWHNIAMDTGAEVIIVEKSHTHVSDFVFRTLKKDEQEKLATAIQSLLEPKK